MYRAVHALNVQCIMPYLCTYRSWGWWTSRTSPRPLPVQRAGVYPEQCRTPFDNEGQGCCVWHSGRGSAPTTRKWRLIAVQHKTTTENQQLIVYSTFSESANFQICNVNDLLLCVCVCVAESEQALYSTVWFSRMNWTDSSFTSFLTLLYLWGEEKQRGRESYTYIHTEERVLIVQFNDCVSG